MIQHRCAELERINEHRLISEKIEIEVDPDIITRWNLSIPCIRCDKTNTVSIESCPFCGAGLPKGVES